RRGHETYPRIHARPADRHHRRGCRALDLDRVPLKRSEHDIMSNINGDPTDTFDYIIVGAGAAGSILANRLSEAGKSTICSLKGGRSAVQPPSTAWPTTVASPETSTRGLPPETRGGDMSTCCPTSSALSAKSAGEMMHIMGVRVNKPSLTWTGSTRFAKLSSP